MLRPAVLVSVLCVSVGLVLRAEVLEPRMSLDRDCGCVRSKWESSNVYDDRDRTPGRV